MPLPQEFKANQQANRETSLAGSLSALIPESFTIPVIR
jgi:hypothetical protein